MKTDTTHWSLEDNQSSWTKIVRFEKALCGVVKFKRNLVRRLNELDTIPRVSQNIRRILGERETFHRRRVVLGRG